MTTDKARKRAVRNRMTKTGESYTAARRHATPPPTAADPIAPLPPRVAEPEVSEDAVRRATGRGWDDWLRVLDERGTDGFSHRATAAWLREELGVDSWWAQTITVGFERARGLRAAYQVGGGFSVGVSKTLPAPVERLWAAFAEEAGRSRWLELGLLRPRTSQPGRTARFDVAGGTSRLLVSFTSKGEAKASVTIQHEHLASAAEVEERRAFWRARLAALGELLTDEPATSAPGPATAPVPTEGPSASRSASGPGVTPLDAYLAGIDPARAPLVVDLDRLVRATAPELDVALKYRMLTYAIGGDWWRWVCAISVTKQAVNLRLLYGTRLRAGAGVLRPGSSHLANLDLLPGAPPDADLVTRLVREAVERHAEFLAAERRD